MRVSDLMSSNVVSLAPEDTVTHAARMLERHNLGALPVCGADGKLRGIVTDRDIVLRCIASENPPEEMRVREVMTRNIVSVAPGDDVRAATRLMASEQVRRLPVVDGQKIVGMLSLADMARRNALDREASHVLSDISTPPRTF